MVNLLNFSKQEYEHHMWSIYLAFPSENMGAIGSQFTWPLQATTFTSTTMLTYSSIMCCWLNYVIIVHVLKASKWAWLDDYAHPSCTQSSSKLTCKYGRHWQSTTKKLRN